MNRPPHHQPDFILDIEARASLLCVIRQALSAWCQRAGLDTDRTDRICLAVDEAAANIIRHAYAGASGRIRLSAFEERDSEPPMLRFVLDDDGTQVDLKTIRARDLTDVRPGGLGVHLICEVMDEAVWEHRPEGGTRLTMRTLLTTLGNEPIQENVHHA
ncbi:MAG: ATP-binding protein [Planctomycetes bacterium]|jgi:anti-sigma regulatory factor (Ser/Thr protein kinase)|nr:ATP-binding protein [Planctomycetota bacterium]